MNSLQELWSATGFPEITWQMMVMWPIVGLFIYLAVVKGFEPLLLVPISLGALIANLPIRDFILQPPSGDEPGGLFYYLNKGITLQIFPPLIFLGVGAMVDFGPLIVNPRMLLLGGAAQCGIFGTFIVAPLFGFDLAQSAAVAVIGGADGPTSIFTASKLAPDLLGPIAVAAYSYMALVPLI